MFRRVASGWQAGETAAKIHDIHTRRLFVADSSNQEFGYSQNGGQGPGFYDFFPGQQNEGLAFGHAANPSLSPRNGESQHDSLAPSGAVGLPSGRC